MAHRVKKRVTENWDDDPMEIEIKRVMYKQKLTELKKIRKIQQLADSYFEYRVRGRRNLPRKLRELIIPCESCKEDTAVNASLYWLFSEFEKQLQKMVSERKDWETKISVATRIKTADKKTNFAPRIPRLFEGFDCLYPRNVQVGAMVQFPNLETFRVNNLVDAIIVSQANHEVVKLDKKCGKHDLTLLYLHGLLNQQEMYEKLGGSNQIVLEFIARAYFMAPDNFKLGTVDNAIPAIEAYLAHRGILPDSVFDERRYAVEYSHQVETLSPFYVEIWQNDFRPSIKHEGLQTCHSIVTFEQDGTLYFVFTNDRRNAAYRDVMNPKMVGGRKEKGESDYDVLARELNEEWGYSILTGSITKLGTLVGKRPIEEKHFQFKYTVYETSVFHIHFAEPPHFLMEENHQPVVVEHARLNQLPPVVRAFAYAATANDKVIAFADYSLPYEDSLEMGAFYFQKHSNAYEATLVPNEENPVKYYTYQGLIVANDQHKPVFEIRDDYHFYPVYERVEKIPFKIPEEMPEGQTIGTNGVGKADNIADTRIPYIPEDMRESIPVVQMLETAAERFINQPKSRVYYPVPNDRKPLHELAANPDYQGVFESNDSRQRWALLHIGYLNSVGKRPLTRMSYHELEVTL